MFNEIWKVGGKPISSAPDADGTRHDTHMLWAPKYKRIDQCVDKTDEDWEDGLSGFRNEKQNKEKQLKINMNEQKNFWSHRWGKVNLPHCCMKYSCTFCFPILLWSSLAQM